MLKYVHDEENGEQILEIKGNLLEILAECTYMVKTVYQQLHEQGHKEAEVFRDLMIRSIGDENSPVWVDKSRRDILIDKLESILDKLKNPGE